MRIGELARTTGVSARSLRHYEQAGLIAPSRLESGYRDYDAAEVMTVGVIKTLISAGLVLQEIVEVLPCVEAAGGYERPTTDLVAQLEAKRQQLCDQREELSRAILILGGAASRAR
jgi:DNA-binding transcriptional MerR regulator